MTASLPAPMRTTFALTSTASAQDTSHPGLAVAHRDNCAPTQALDAFKRTINT